MKDISFGQYFPTKSFVHRMDPIVKLMIVIANIVEVNLVF